MICLRDQEIIQIKTAHGSASIINDGIIKAKINKEKFNEDKVYVIEKINTLELNSESETELVFNVLYDIKKNEFKNNAIATNNSELLVRFSYSYDNISWTYLNNNISTNTSNIKALIGNNYDIAGITSKLNVATNYKIVAKKDKPIKMYWRSETIFKDLDDEDDVFEK